MCPVPTEATLCTTSLVQECHVHYQAPGATPSALRTMVRKRKDFGSAQCSFVLIRCMFVINSDPNGAQYDIVSLDVCVCRGGVVRPTLCTTSWVQDYIVHRRPALCTMVHKGYEHANQGSQCSSVLMYTLVVHNVALY